MSLLVVSIVITSVSKISKLQQEIKSREEAEKHMRYLAYYDNLTNLPNRTFFKELLKQAISNARRSKLIFALLFIDLDDFKRINDTLGHDMGDRLLQAVSNRLLKSFRNSDLIARLDETESQEAAARLGGDEFVLILHNLAHIHDAGKAASRILDRISKPFDLDGHEVFITASIGISIYPPDGEEITDLLKNADVAMYQAKEKGRNSYQYYSKSMNTKALEYLTLSSKLHKALENGEFLLHYQPQKSIKENKITGLEALLRWKPADSDFVPPSQFIPLLEESGLIIPVGEWVLRTACLQNAAWQADGYEPIVISVNISNRQFNQKNLIDVVTGALHNADLNPEYLDMEITESMIMKEPEAAIATLQELKNMGIKISMDDFGTGYSSLNYLRFVPLNAIKIDRSFVMNLAESQSNEAIIEAIIALSHSLDLNVVAEGVETEQQLTFLKSRGCDVAQGYLLSRPLPAGEVSKFLTNKMEVVESL
ncbi:MAG: EAL domain-containing protein [Nitrospirae bacterium]|nr:EAL domain-containing protein [Nitrospirota bacterium]